jgi:hypothetical protein
MKCSNHKLMSGDRVLIYSDREQIVLQIRHQTPTEENLLDPSFKVAVTLSPADALLVASELLAAAVPRLTTAEQSPALNGEDHRDEQ